MMMDVKPNVYESYIKVMYIHSTQLSAPSSGTENKILSPLKDNITFSSCSFLLFHSLKNLPVGHSSLKKMGAIELFLSFASQNYKSRSHSGKKA